MTDDKYKDYVLARCFDWDGKDELYFNGDTDTLSPVGWLKQLTKNQNIISSMGEGYTSVWKDIVILSSSILSKH